MLLASGRQLVLGWVDSLTILGDCHRHKSDSTIPGLVLFPAPRDIRVRGGAFQTIAVRCKVIMFQRGSVSTKASIACPLCRLPAVLRTAGRVRAHDIAFQRIRLMDGSGLSRFRVGQRVLEPQRAGAPRYGVLIHRVTSAVRFPSV